MASAEMQLVCKIIKTGELRRVLEWGITEDDFLNLEPKGIFKQLIAIFTNPETSGSVLGPRLATEKFGQLNIDEVDTHVTIEHLCSEIRQRRILKEVQTAAQQALEEHNALAAYDILTSASANIRRLDAGKFTDVAMDVGMGRVWATYQAIKAGVQTGVFPFPWELLQDETGGAAKDDYIVFYGRPKSMKSWVLAFLIAWCVEEAWLDHNLRNHPMTKHQRVLVYTKEMTPDNVYMRIAACLAGVPYSDVRHATLTPSQEMSLLYWVEQAKEMAKDNRLIVLSAKDVAGRDTVSWLRTKVEKYAPTVLFVDGLYLMSPENQKIVKMNERVASISRDMRQLILDTGVPVIATMQANRQAAKHEEANLDEIAFSDAVSQDATQLVRVINDKDDVTISLVWGGAREINFAGMRIYGVPATNFGYHSRLDFKAIEEAKKADDAEVTPKKREPKTLGGNGHHKDNGVKKSAVEKAFDKNLKKALDEM